MIKITTVMMKMFSDGLDSRPTVTSTLAVSDDVSKLKFKKLGNRKVDLDGDLGAEI